MNGAERIAAERQRQVEVEGWGAEHDAGHGLELIQAAASYLHDAIRQGENPYQPPEVRRRSSLWPWAPEYWKPATVERDLEKAGALIAAALDSFRANTGAERAPWAGLRPDSREQVRRKVTGIRANTEPEGNDR